MTTGNRVDAALAGLDQGEAVTIPPLHEVNLWQRDEAARLEIFGAARTGVPAPRYQKSLIVKAGHGPPRRMINLKRMRFAKISPNK